MKKLFSGEDLTAAMTRFDSEVKKHGLTPVEVALRWIAHHSALEEQDGILLGASRAEQIVQAVGFIRKGPLETEIVELAEQLWNAVKETRSEVI